MNDRDGAIEVMMEELEKAEREATRASEKVSSLRANIRDRLRVLNRKAYDYDNGESKFRATLVKTAPIQVDFEKLVSEKVLTDEELELITERSFSKKLLETAVDAGQIGASKIAPFLTRAKESYSVRFKGTPVSGD